MRRTSRKNSEHRVRNTIFEYIRENAKIYLTAKNRTNNDANKDSWKPL